MDGMSVLAHLFNVSISASFLALAVVIFRLIFKKTPRWFVVLLWALVAIRLICPFSIESVFSLVPTSEAIPGEILTLDPDKIPDASFGLVENPYYSEYINSTVEIDNLDRFQFNFMFSVFIWFVGVALMLMYAVASYVKLKWIVRTAIASEGNVWICDEVKSPFILGVFRPRIFLPSDMNEATAKLVLRHEKAHLKRRDHLWKPLGFILLSVYWFNPVLWLSFILLCRDIELACDEKVIKDMESTDKRAYSEALLLCSVSHRMISACPVAFGEVGVKNRIRSVLNYKKPTFWVMAVAVIVSIAIFACFMTEPKSKNGGVSVIYGVDDISEHSFNMQNIVFSAHSYTIYEGADTTDNYFEAKIEDAFCYTEVSSFLNTITLGETADGVVMPQSNGVIKINYDDYWTVSVIFYDNFQKMYLQRYSSDYNVRSKDYAVVNVEQAKQFFEDKPYKSHALVWEYNPASSAWGHSEINVFVDEKYKINGKVEGDGNIGMCVDNEKGLEGIYWRPYVEENHDLYNVEIPVIHDGEEGILSFTMRKVGKKGLSSYYTLCADDLVIGSFPEGYKFVLSEAEKKENIIETEPDTEIWHYNPMAGGTWFYITRYILPEDYEIISADAEFGTATIEDIYYNEPEKGKCVHWSPDENSMKSTQLVITAIKKDVEVKFCVDILPVSSSCFKISGNNCRLKEEEKRTGVFLLEEK